MFKGLLSKIFGRESEQLVAMLQPREIVGRGLTPADALDFYSSFLKNLESSARSSYDREFDVTDSSTPRNINTTFVNGDVKITYQASPVISVIPGGDDNPTIYGGFLCVDQATIDTSLAGRLIEKMSPHSLLAYRTGGDFQISHHRGENTLAEGKQLLDGMDLSLKDVCEYLVFPGVVGWGYVDLGNSPTH